MVAENPADDALRKQPPIPRLIEFHSGNINITDSYGPLVLAPLPYGHMFLVTSTLMQMLTAKGLFLGLPSEDPHAHIVKLRSVCKIVLGGQT